MILLISVALFLLGAILASFAGVVAERLNTGQSFLDGRSRCDACGAELSPVALVPIFSYFILRGRALCCGARLSLRAPITEALLGALFVLSYLQLGPRLALPFFLFSLTVVLALVLYDLAHQILPFSLLVVFFLSSVVTRLLLARGLESFLFSFVAPIFIALVLALIHFFSGGRAMGLADTPLAFALAVLVGSEAFSGFVYSFWIGAVIGIVLLLRRPRGSRMGVEVPFAPYLAAGFLLAYFTQWNLFTLIVAASR